MTEKLSIAGILQAAIALNPPEDPRIFVALAERIAAERYRGWAESVDDEARRRILLECAAREEYIAGRVEALRPDAVALQEQILKDHPDLPSQYKAVLDGMTLRDQFAAQAEAECAGAAAWRAFAATCSDPKEAETLLSCAPLEEASAAALEQIIASMAETNR